MLTHVIAYKTTCSFQDAAAVVFI